MPSLRPVALIAALLFGLTAPPSLAQAGVTIDELVKLKQAGFSDQDVIASLAGKQFPALSRADERRLRAAGATDRLVEWLQQRAGNNGGPLAQLPAAPQGAPPAWPGVAATPQKRPQVTVATLIAAHRAGRRASELMAMIARSPIKVTVDPAGQGQLLAAKVPGTVRALLSGRQLSNAAALDLLAAGEPMADVLELLARVGLDRSPGVSEGLAWTRAGLSPAQLKRMRAGAMTHPPEPFVLGGRPTHKIFASRRASADKDATVQAALKWLAAFQSDQGHWDADGSERGKLSRVLGRARLDWVDLGASGLALLAFSGAGHTHLDGPYKATVDRGLGYLLGQQTKEGRIGGRRGHYMYNHAIATLALAEAYHLSGDARLAAPLERAARWLLRARNPGMAWRYGARDGANDVSVTSWCLMALRSAQIAGCAPGTAAAAPEAIAYLDGMTDSTYGVTGYSRRPPRGWQGPTSCRFVNDEMGINTATTHAPNHAPTAIAVASRAVFGIINRPAIDAGGLATVLSMLPDARVRGGGAQSKIDGYYWLQGSRAVWHAGQRKDWTRWQTKLRQAIVPTQDKQGATAGSWNPVRDAWGPLGGRVYTTAIYALALQTPYRYPQAMRGLD